MGFITYDLIFLVVFAIFVSIFLYRGKSNIKREGLLLLYKTEWGIKLINYVGHKYKRTMKVLSYISICIGYILMASSIYFVYYIVKIYLLRPDVSSAMKVPPIMPLIPYLPQMFKLDFLPPFYFFYWIIILAIVAIFHEFSHGIFAAYNKVKIKKTGFGFFPFFLPVFLAAFVELDEKRMAKKSKFSQMTVLSAGTFANIITAGIFILILWGFFSLAFAPQAVVFDAYPYEFVNLSNINSINGIAINSPNYEQVLWLMKPEGLNELSINNKNYLIDKVGFEKQKNNEAAASYGIVALFNEGPAIKYGLNGPISKINNIPIKSISALSDELEKYSPGDKLTLEIIENNSERYNLDIILGENPENPEKAWLGIGFYSQQTTGLKGITYKIVTSFKEPNVYYSSNFGDLSMFIYNLLWWLILICISVAIVNMLPVGIFDGGRFFYLTIFGITKNENIAKKAFSFVTYLFLAIIFIMLLLWVFNFFR